MKHRKTKARVGVAMFAAAALPLGVLAVTHGPNEHANPKAAAAHAKHADKVKNPKAVEAQNQVKVKNPTCVLVVPKDPTSATGLGSTYVLGDGNTDCSVANPATAVTVTATITAADGTVTTVNPTVIDDPGEDADMPAPVPVTLADGSKVTLSVSFAGERLKLVGAGHKTPITVTNGVAGP